jgi:Ca2+-binding RTX toxin-like protein
MRRRRIATLLIAGLTALAAPAAARADVGTFSNAASITLPDLGQGNPYPTNITVSGLTGVVTDVNASVISFDYSPNPDDAEVLLVAPNGKTTVLMADAGGTVASVNDTINFDDSAQFPVPDSGGIVNGATHQPADYEMPGLEPFNSPAPSPPYGLTLSNLNGGTPNGTWSLYTFADFFNGSGGGDISGGWTVTVTSAVPAPAQGTCRGKTATITGTEAGETLTGTPGPDVVAALGGNDKVSTLGGKDLVCAGAGNDKANGGAGKDTLAGEAGKDQLVGGGGPDTLLGQAGNDTCKGGKAEDTAKKCEVKRSI